jgi:hypothetical protein
MAYALACPTLLRQRASDRMHVPLRDWRKLLAESPESRYRFQGRPEWWKHGAVTRVEEVAPAFVASFLPKRRVFPRQSALGFPTNCPSPPEILPVSSSCFLSSTLLNPLNLSSSRHHLSNFSAPSRFAYSRAHINHLHSTHLNHPDLPSQAFTL